MYLVIRISLPTIIRVGPQALQAQQCLLSALKTPAEEHIKSIIRENQRETD